jgi:CRISPR system Cascade subunit CasC
MIRAMTQTTPKKKVRTPMKIEIHILQNFVPSCLNRDDTNTPKECDFGGVRRARISSQCFKRAIREHFKASGGVTVGDRTKLIAHLLVEKLKSKGRDEVEAFSVVTTALAGLKLTITQEEEKYKSQYLLFISPAEIDSLVALIDSHWDELQKIEKMEESEDKKSARDKKKEAKGALSPEFNKAINNILKGNDAVDIGLFGRMLADQAGANVDAACQVAHAISTHTAALEMDFFTAVDDLNSTEETGAGMLGYTGFQSACFYRYAVLDVSQLQTNIHGDANDAKKAVEAFLTAFCEAEPSAKQNSMLAQNRPSFGLIVARETGVPTSLANAFCKPVSTKQANPDLAGYSVTALADYHDKLNTVYDAFETSTQAVFWDGSGDLKQLNAFDKGSQRKAIATILEKL